MKLKKNKKLLICVAGRKNISIKTILSLFPNSLLLFRHLSSPPCYHCGYSQSFQQGRLWSVHNTSLFAGLFLPQSRGSDVDSSLTTGISNCSDVGSSMGYSVTTCGLFSFPSLLFALLFTTIPPPSPPRLLPVQCFLLFLKYVIIKCCCAQLWPVKWKWLHSSQGRPWSLLTEGTSAADTMSFITNTPCSFGIQNSVSEWISRKRKQ